MDVVTTHKEDGFIINTVTKDCEASEVFEYLTTHFDDWLEDHIIWDLRQFTFTNVLRSDLATYLELSRHFSHKRAGLKTALIAESDLAYGMCRMLASMARGLLQAELEAFQDMQQAKSWLQEHMAALH